MSKTSRLLEWILFGFLFLILVLASCLFFYQRAYAGKIYRNVSVGNYDLGGKSKDQARFIVKKMHENLLSQQIVIKTDDKELETTLVDTGLSIDIEKVVDECYKTGRSTNFIEHLISSAKTTVVKKEVRLQPTIIDEKYRAFVDIAIGQLNIEPEDAKLVIEKGEIKETPEINGKSVKTENLMDKLLALAFENNKLVTLETIIKPSKVQAADFQEARNQAEAILSKKFIFTYDGKSYSPDRSEIGLWIDFKTENDKYTAVLNDNNIGAYLNKIAKNFEVPKKDIKINQLDGSIVDPGQEGKYLDKNVVLSKIKNSINEKILSIELTTYTESPKEIKILPAEGLVPGRFEGRYLDVDLTSQKLCRVEATNIVDCFIISSGKPGMGTPTGTYTITGKNPRQYSNKYGLWMPWWQQFSGDYGLHELPETATWKEVPDHLGTPVSHGCVRLGVGPAQTVYEWTSIGTPVYIHK